MQHIKPQSHAIEPNALTAGKMLSATEKGPWPTTKWWVVYGDAQLNSLVEKACSDNPSVEAALARVRVAQAYVDVLAAGNLPQIFAGGSVAPTVYPQDMLYPSVFAGHYALMTNIFAQANFDLDLWGRNRNAVRGAFNLAQAADVDVQQARLILQTLVVQTYVALAQTFATQKLNEDILKGQLQLVEFTKKLLGSGLMTVQELTRVEAAVPPLQIALKTQHDTQEILKNRLAALLGQGPGAADGIKAPDLHFTGNLNLPTHLPAELVGRRPDVVAQLWRVEAAARAIDVARAAFYPNINLVALLSLGNVGFAPLLHKESFGGSITPALTLPIFEGGRLRGNLKLQSATFDVLVNEYNQTVIDAMRQVVDQVTRWKSLDEEHADILLAIALAKRNFNMSDASYKAGLGDYREVVQARLNWLRQQQADVALRFSIYGTYAGLVQSLGGEFAANDKAAKQVQDATHNLSRETRAH